MLLEFTRTIPAISILKLIVLIYIEYLFPEAN